MGVPRQQRHEKAPDDQRGCRKTQRGRTAHRRRHLPSRAVAQRPRGAVPGDVPEVAGNRGRKQSHTAAGCGSRREETETFLRGCNG